MVGSTPTRLRHILFLLKHLTSSRGNMREHFDPFMFLLAAKAEQACCSLFADAPVQPRYRCPSTLATRQTLGAAASSSIEAFFCWRHSLRASIAPSRPTLLRNLKQSATVFAGENTRRVAPEIEYSFIPK